MKTKGQAGSMKILVRAPHLVADQVMAYPFFHYLRELYPQAQVTVVGESSLESLQYRHLVNQFIVIPEVKTKSFWSDLRGLKQVISLVKAQGPWDLGFILPSCFLSAWMFFRIGVKCRVGYRSSGRSLLLNAGRVLNKKTVLHQSEAFVALLFGAEKKLPPVLEFWGGLWKESSSGAESEEGSEDSRSEGRAQVREEGVLDRFPVERAWPHAFPLDPPQQPFWVIAPDVEVSSRQWPAAYFEKLADLLFEKMNLSGVILGSQIHSQWVKRLEERYQDKLILIESSSIASYWKILTQAQFTICNDSEWAHVASLCGSPTFVIWGAGRIAKTQPLGVGRVQMNVHPVECWPCEQAACQQPQSLQLQCLVGIRPEVLFESIMKEVQCRAKS